MRNLVNPEAFPRPASRGNNYLTGEEDTVVDPQRGMSLLDYFAAHAVAGLAAGDPTSAAGELAFRAYSIAEAMLAARARIGTYR